MGNFLDSIKNTFMNATMAGIGHSVGLVAVPWAGMLLLSIVGGTLGLPLLEAMNPLPIPLVFWMFWTLFVFMSSAILSTMGY